MRTVAVVAHAEAVHHVERVVGGWHDSQLTERGRRQAHRVALILAGSFPGPRVPVVTSDLRRARQTAEIIAGTLGSDVTLHPGFRELSYGVAEGRPRAWLDERIVPVPTAGSRLDHHICEGAESRRDLATRVYAAMAEVLASDASDAVIVTHGFAATFVIACWIGMPIESTGLVSFASSPAGFSLLVEDAPFTNRRVQCLNDTRHLAQVERDPS